MYKVFDDNKDDDSTVKQLVFEAKTQITIIHNILFNIPMFCFGKIFLKVSFFTQTLRESRFHVQTFLLLLHSSFTLSLELTHLLYHIFIDENSF